MRPKYIEEILKLLKPDGIFLGALFISNSKPDRISILPGEDGPPFWSVESEVRDLFISNFTIEELEPSRSAHEDRKTLEWSAHFTRNRPG